MAAVGGTSTPRARLPLQELLDLVLAMMADCRVQALLSFLTVVRSLMGGVDFGMHAKSALRCLASPPCLHAACITFQPATTACVALMLK